jgi:hypothetical protein
VPSDLIATASQLKADLCILLLLLTASTACTWYASLSRAGMVGCVEAHEVTHAPFLNLRGCSV